MNLPSDLPWFTLAIAIIAWICARTTGAKNYDWVGLFAVISILATAFTAISGVGWVMAFWRDGGLPPLALAFLCLVLAVVVFALWIGLPKSQRIVDGVWGSEFIVAGLTVVCSLVLAFVFSLLWPVYWWAVGFIHPLT